MGMSNPLNRRVVQVCLPLNCVGLVACALIPGSAWAAYFPVGVVLLLVGVFLLRKSEEH